MPQVSSKALIKGIFAASAVSLVFGAVQFASGRDLGSVPQAPVSQVSLPSAGVSINRATKADRAAGVPASAGQTQTISLKPDGFLNISVLVRMPLTHAARDTSFAKPSERKLACEPVVSALTEVAKQLEPGRCVT
jgi:hypothetical protein